MRHTCAIMLAGMLCTGSLAAESLHIPLGQQAQDLAISLPQRGATQNAVRQQYGEPLQARTVGQPPITRWTYQDFEVYFEGHYVIHSVRVFRAQHPQR